MMKIAECVYDSWDSWNGRIPTCGCGYIHCDYDNCSNYYPKKNPNNEKDPQTSNGDRKEILINFTDDELLQIIKENLDELGIAYEERPGGFGDFLRLNPPEIY